VRRAPSHELEDEDARQMIREGSVDGGPPPIRAMTAEDARDAAVGVDVFSACFGGWLQSAPGPIASIPSTMPLA
jgi:hypothetical protein